MFIINIIILFEKRGLFDKNINVEIIVAAAYPLIVWYDIEIILIYCIALLDYVVEIKNLLQKVMSTKYPFIPSRWRLYRL